MTTTAFKTRDNTAAGTEMFAVLAKPAMIEQGRQRRMAPTPGSKTQKRKANRGSAAPKSKKKKGGGLNSHWGGVIAPTAPGSHGKPK